MGETDALPAILVGGHLCNNLCGDIAGGGKTMWCIYFSAAYNSTVAQHIFKVNKVAIMHMLGKIIGIVEVNYAAIVSLYYLLR